MPKRPTRDAKKKKPVEDVEEEEEEEVPAVKKVKSGLTAGDQFPDLGSLETDESTADEPKHVVLEDVLKEHGIVVFAYPKANTGGCTNQACGFRDKVQEFEEAGYKVFGISADKPKSQKSWKEKYNLNYTLLTADANREALQKLGFARGANGINRSHIVVAKGGEVLDVKVGVKPADSFNEALKTVKAAAVE